MTAAGGRALNGWRRQRPSRQDWLLSPNIGPISPPPVYSNRPLCSPVENQAAIGSCVANSVVGALEFLENKARAAWPEDGTHRPHFVDLSRLFVYWGARYLEGTPATADAGCQVRDAIRWLAKKGTCPEALWPYRDDGHTFALRPDAAAFEAAHARRLLAYYAIQDGPSATMLERTVAAGYCIAFGFSVPEWFQDEVGAKKVMRVPDRDDPMVGGHAVLIVGYDRPRHLFEVRNSWGTDWGDAGYFWMDYRAVVDRGLSGDFWVPTKELLPQA